MGLGLQYLNLGLYLDDLSSSVLFIILQVISGVDLVQMLSYMLIYGNLKGNIVIMGEFLHREQLVLEPTSLIKIKY